MSFVTFFPGGGVIVWRFDSDAEVIETSCDARVVPHQTNYTDTATCFQYTHSKLYKALALYTNTNTHIVYIYGYKRYIHRIRPCWI